MAGFPRLGARARQWDPSISLVAGPRPQADTAAGSTPAIALDPYLFPPPGSRTLFASDQANIAGAGTSLSLPGCKVQLEKGWCGVVRALQIEADAPVKATRARWSVNVNGKPAAGLNALALLWRDAASDARDLDNLRVELPDNALVEVVVTNIDGVARIYGAQLIGWLFKVVGV